ncbi:MAG TPA: phosphoribosylglycinamide formyltransferase [Vicinamibacterales bacterium]|nr:phosphoribosylglycinamide formyltransferase [Vicinamibacterales bacterium]
MADQHVSGPPESLSRRLGVLISGRGSNLQAILDAIASGRLTAAVAVVMANRPDAGGLARAQAAGIEAICLDHQAYADRHAYDEALAAELRRREVGVICLAGFMRKLGPRFIDAFPNRILNIHPSLLPAFPGLHAQRQAIAHGVKVSGATVHFVTTELDAGPIVLQAAVPVRDEDTEETLSARILVEEHRIYPEAIRIVLEGRWSIAGRRFIRT